MPELSAIAWEDFQMPVFRQWAKDWLLLCAGDFNEKKYNMMTVGWGSFGVIWGKPFAMILVRPQRFTMPILDEYPTFTLSAFPAANKDALSFCGSKSGRDYADKAAAAGLTPVASHQIGAPGFAEAELIFECKKIYGDELKAAGYIPPFTADEWYPQKDYHRVIYGEIVGIYGTGNYRNPAR